MTPLQEAAKQLHDLAYETDEYALQQLRIAARLKEAARLLAAYAAKEAKT